ncbi:ribonuclease H family protein [Ancylobacter oerskovii]|uniref:Ribonuclease H n=1 Tax=Ancylobacter oerskovii TaxID=459519 RepID=A0ABW4YUG7_9HYPH|nr:ribonuclease HI [Ancylobacter oerskovii]
MTPGTIIGYADGSALDNPGPAGWAVILRYPNGSHRTLAGSCEHSTCNRMELTAAIEALASVGDDVPFALHLDSNYVVKGATLWRPQWKARGWRNANGKPVANRDLWERLYTVLDARPLATLKWVRGHAGNELNEAVDRLARAEAEKVRLAQGGISAALFGRGAAL